MENKPLTAETLPKTHAELIPYYERMQETQGYGGAPRDMGRAVELYCFITSQLNAGSTVIDCSCGRGLLLSLLQKAGYVIEGTEASEWIIEHHLRPRNIPIRKLLYSELHTLKEKNWDVVVSIDVLEHLLTEDEVRDALLELARMAKRWLCITVGTDKSAIGQNGKFIILHHVLKEPDWWVQEVHAVADVMKHYRYHNSYVIFAKKRQQPTSSRQIPPPSPGLGEFYPSSPEEVPGCASPQSRGPEL